MLFNIVYVPFKLLKASLLHIVSRCLCAVWAQEAAKCEVGTHCTSRTAFCIGTLRPGLIGIGSSSGSQKSNMSYEVILRWQKQGRSAEWCYPLRVQSVRWSMSWDVVSLSMFKLTATSTIVHSSTIISRSTLLSLFQSGFHNCYL